MAVAALPQAHQPDTVTATAGTARGEDNYILSRDLPVEGGINRVLLRAGTQAGTIRLSAMADGLKSAVLVIPAVLPKPANDGLSSDFPERYQLGLLTRGPTPKGSSFRLRRTTLVPVAIRAGANEADASRSIDDNERSRWTSDGKPGTAWIEYRFERPVTLSEIELKLVGWRSRSCPLRITLDGRTVWQGQTERQLGYAVLAFAPTTGQVLRITQTGTVEDRDGFGRIVELNNARSAGDTGADTVPPGWTLAIVEADFHGPVGARR
jgi:hypothetical protein